MKTKKNKLVLAVLLCATLFAATLAAILPSRTSHTAMAMEQEQEFLSEMEWGDAYLTEDEIPVQPTSMIQWTPERLAEAAALDIKAVGWEAAAEALAKNSCPTTVPSASLITNHIPLALFRHRGEYLFIGEKYGFFVKSQNYMDVAALYSPGISYCNLVRG